MELVSLIGFPLLVLAGGIIYWKRTREVLSLVMAAGMLPALASLIQFLWGPSLIITLDNGVQTPDQGYLDIAEILGTFASIGSLVSGGAFVLLASRAKSPAANVT